MTDKIKIVIEHVDEWKKKDYKKFSEDFENFVEQLKITQDEAHDILNELDAKVEIERESSTDNIAVAFTQYAADFLSTMLDDFENDNDDEGSLKFLVKE